MAAVTIEDVLRTGDSRYALHSGYGLVEVLDLPARQLEGLGQVVAVSPVQSDLADLLQFGEIELHDEVVLGWSQTDETPMDLSIRWVAPSELVPISSLKAAVREKLLNGKRYTAYLDGESMEARDEFLPGPYPVAMEVSGRLITVSRLEKVVELEADESWFLRAVFRLMIQVLVGPPIRTKKSRRLLRFEREQRRKNGCIPPSLSTTTMEDVQLKIDEKESVPF